MNSPSSALAWEIWQRHRNRLIAIGVAILGFALIYPKICALYGLRLDLPNALDAIPEAEISARLKQGHPLIGIAEILTVLFLLLSPLACMLLSLLYLVWIFTFAETDVRKGFAVPARLFRLPISSVFLVSWLSVVGAATVTLVFLGWTRLVHQPRIDIFEGYPNLLIWLTLLWVAQGVVWALDGFPILRLLALSAAICFFGFLAGPSIHDHPSLEQNQLGILLSLLAIGGCSAFVGLDKIRHGEWQTWALPEFLRSFTVRRAANCRGAFKRAAHAQFWFEWRRSGQKLVIATCALGGVALAIMAVVAARVGVLSDGDTTGLALYLLAVPVFLHFVQGIMPDRALPIFLAARPLTSGEVVMAKLKASALSASLSWLMAFGFLAFVPLLGSLSGQFDPARFLDHYQHWPILLPVILVGVIFLTWRLVAVNLCFGINHRWLKLWPVLSPYALLILYGLLVFYGRKPGFSQAVSAVLPFILGTLVALKFWLARRIYRVCLSRGWLSRSALIKYLGLWATLAILFLLPTIVFFRQADETVSLVLAIVLLLPLARIGQAVLVVSLNRHR